MFFRASGRLSGPRQRDDPRRASQTGKDDRPPQHRDAGASCDMVSLVVRRLVTGLHDPRKRSSVRRSHRAMPTGPNWTSRLVTRPSRSAQAEFGSTLPSCDAHWS